MRKNLLWTTLSKTHTATSSSSSIKRPESLYTTMVMKSTAESWHSGSRILSWSFGLKLRRPGLSQAWTKLLRISWPRSDMRLKTSKPSTTRRSAYTRRRKRGSAMKQNRPRKKQRLTWHHTLTGSNITSCTRTCLILTRWSRTTLTP